MEILIPIMLMALLLSGMILFALVEGKMTEEAWDAASEHLELQREPRGLTGTYRDIRVEAYRENVTRGSHISTYTMIIAHLDDKAELPAGLLITKEGSVMRKDRELDGNDGIELGVPELDALLVIDGADTDTVRSWVADPVHARPLEDIALRATDFRIDTGAVRLTLGLVRDADVLVTAIENAVGAARALSGMDHAEAVRED